MPDPLTYQPQNRYPVIVEETRRYVLWIEGDQPSDAVKAFNDDPKDPDSDAMFWFHWDAHAPDEHDWYYVQHGGLDGGYRGTCADAHVQTHRNHLAYVKQQEARAACVAAGHPIPDGARGPLTWADYCGTCGAIDPTSRTSVAA
jgi:hypothetical protein